jgi:hypothetical protein
MLAAKRPLVCNFSAKNNHHITHVHNGLFAQTAHPHFVQRINQSPLVGIPFFLLF